MFPVFVINLDRRPDRLNRIAGHLHQLGLEFTRVPAIDAKVLASQDEQRKKKVVDRVSGNRKVCWRIQLGAAAGMLSTSKAMISLLGSNAPAALILQDDAELAPDVPALLNSVEWWPSGVHVVRLEESYQRSPHWSNSAPLWKSSGKTPSGRSLHRLERWCGGAAAYLIDRRGAQIALTAFADPDQTIDHTLFDLRVSKTARQLGTVQVLPAMARQCDEVSDQLAWREAAQLWGWDRRLHRLRRNIGSMPHKAKVHFLRSVGVVQKLPVVYCKHPFCMK